jgi:hypothetical protein
MGKGEIMEGGLSACSEGTDIRRSRQDRWVYQNCADSSIVELISTLYKSFLQEMMARSFLSFCQVCNADNAFDEWWDSVSRPEYQVTVADWPVGLSAMKNVGINDTPDNSIFDLSCW